MEESDVAAAYRAYAPAVYARCVRLLRDRELARDVTQEVFILCMRERRKLRAGRELLGWLYRVATNTSLNALRTRRRRRDGAPSEAERVLQQAPEGGDRHTIVRLLDNMDARTQEIAVYVYVDGMTHAEAAEVARVTDRTVRNCLRRFLERARALLGIEIAERGGA